MATAPPHSDDSDVCEELNQQPVVLPLHTDAPPPPYPGTETATTQPPQQCGYPQAKDYASMQASEYPPNQGDPPPQGYPSQQPYPPQHGYPPPQGYPPQQPYPPPEGYPPQQPYPPSQGYPPQQGVILQGNATDGHVYVPQVGAMQAETQQLVLITTQPAVSYPHYLAFSIFNLICCCCCIGIAALLKSVEVRSANARGDRERAKRASVLALRLNMIALGIGFSLTLLITVIRLISI